MGWPKGVKKGYKVGGRKKGTPNKATASVKAALEEAFNGLGGVPALMRWGMKEPTEFYKIWVKVMPQQINHADPHGNPLAAPENHMHITFDLSSLKPDELEFYRAAASRAAAESESRPASSGSGNGQA